jgi:hypothetical protein
VRTVLGVCVMVSTIVQWRTQKLHGEEFLI